MKHVFRLTQGSDRRRFLEIDETPGYSAAFSQLHNARAAETVQSFVKEYSLIIILGSSC